MCEQYAVYCFVNAQILNKSAPAFCHKPQSLNRSNKPWKTRTTCCANMLLKTSMPRPYAQTLHEVKVKRW